MTSQFLPFHELLIEHLQEGVCYIDANQHITHWNRTAEQITGFTSDELVGTLISNNVLHQSLLSLNPEHIDVSPFEPMSGDQKPSDHRLFLQHPEGHRVLINLKVVPVKNGSGQIGTIGLITDASHQAELEATSRSLQKLLRIDSLTKLPNKRSLFDSMKGEYMRFARYGTPFALIAISIDPPQDKTLIQKGPKRDALVRWVAQQLSVGLRKADTPGRLRGATFLALLPHANTLSAEKAAQKLRILFEATPYPGNGIPITASFGCASISRSDTLDRLIERAKSALKLARDEQGNCVVSL